MIDDLRLTNETICTAWGTFAAFPFVNRKSSIVILWDPEHHPGLFAYFRREFFNAAVLHAGGHAMLHACRFESFFCEMRTQNAGFGREREIGQVHAAIGQFLLDLEYPYSSDARFVFVLLSAGDLATVTPCAVLVIY